MPPPRTTRRPRPRPRPTPAAELAARRKAIGAWWRRSHHFFRFLCASLVLAAAAMVAADGRPPGPALGSGLLWRLEVGLAVVLAVYVFVMVMWLAYQGRWAKIPVPGADGGVESGGTIDDQIETAASGMEEFKEHAKARLDDHDVALQQIRDRLTALDAHRDRRGA
jgi:hypothetical protein